MIRTAPDATTSDIITPRQRALLMIVRQALIMVLGALEDYLEIERSIVPRRKR
jgi:hypothetical protein